MVKFALYGAGRIGCIHAANIVASERAQLAYVYDPNLQMAETIAAKYGVKVADDPDSPLRDAGVDAVIIASSTDTHVALLAASAKAGKAVLCEKPIDLDIDRIDWCRRELAKTQAAIQIGFNRRYDRSHRAVRDAVRNGDIGSVELLVITSRDPELAPLPYLKRSGGIFRDMTIHDFDLARFILGEDPIEEVYATGSVMVDQAIKQLDDVDSAMLILRARSGALIHINNSRRAVYGYDQRVEAFGARGMVLSENVRASTVRRYDYSTSGSQEPLLFSFADRYRQSYIDELNDFIAVVTDGKKPSVDFEDGRVALILADAAFRSVRTSRPVSVSYN